MIILKILLWIILAILGIILLVMILPISANVSFIGGKVAYGVKFSGLPVFNSKGKGIVNGILNKKKKPQATEGQPEAEQSTDTTDNSENEAVETVKPVENSATTESLKPEAEQPAEATETVEAVEVTADSEVTETAETPENTSDTETKPKNQKKPKKEKEKQSMIELILGIWEAADRPLLRIFKGIKLSELYIDFIIANEDAYKCAMNYGRISGAVYNLIAWLSVLFNVKLKTVDVLPAFAQKKSQFDISLKVSFSLITIVIAGFQFLLIYIFRVFIPSKINLLKK